MFNKYFEEYKNSIVSLALAQVRIDFSIGKEADNEEGFSSLFYQLPCYLEEREKEEIFSAIIIAIGSAYPSAEILRETINSIKVSIKF